MNSASEHDVQLQRVDHSGLRKAEAGRCDPKALLADELVIEPITEVVNRRSESDRRERSERRRSAKGLFEFRARREKISEDRRREERRTFGKFKLAFWR